jgi:hypothetical protein
VPDLVDKASRSKFGSRAMIAMISSCSGTVTAVHLAHVKTPLSSLPRALEQGTCRLACMAEIEAKIDKLLIVRILARGPLFERDVKKLAGWRRE